MKVFGLLSLVLGMSHGAYDCSEAASVEMCEMMKMSLGGMTNTQLCDYLTASMECSDLTGSACSGMCGSDDDGECNLDQPFDLLAESNPMIGLAKWSVCEGVSAPACDDERCQAGEGDGDACESTETYTYETLMGCDLTTPTGTAFLCGAAADAAGENAMTACATEIGAVTDMAPLMAAMSGDMAPLFEAMGCDPEAVGIVMGEVDPMAAVATWAATADLPSAYGDWDTCMTTGTGCSPLAGCAEKAEAEAEAAAAASAGASADADTTSAATAAMLLGCLSA